MVMSEYETWLADLWETGSFYMRMIEVEVLRNVNHWSANTVAMPQTF
jgi:hypothetical protein